MTMSRKIISALLVFLFLASVSIPAVSAVDATYESLHALCEKHPKVDSADPITSFVFQNYKIGYSVKYTGYGADIWTFFADKEIVLNIEIHADMDKEIYRKSALFINDVDFVQTNGYNVLNAKLYSEALEKHKRAIATLKDLKRVIGDHSNSISTTTNYVTFPRMR